MLPQSDKMPMPHRLVMVEGPKRQLNGDLGSVSMRLVPIERYAPKQAAPRPSVGEPGSNLAVAPTFIMSISLPR